MVQRSSRSVGAAALTTAAALMVAGVLLLTFPPAATWFEQASQVAALEQQHELQQRQAAAARAGEPAADPFEHQLHAAREFNARLATGLVDSTTPEYLKQYRQQLTVDGTEVIARVRIDAIGVDQPLRHTFSERSLTSGLGHAERSSLPVGGAGTHAVIGGHRGLATAIGLTDLPEVELGDVIRIDVLGQRLQYRVISTDTVSPETADEQPIQPGRDLVTLVTCTPKNVNSHRFIVTAERIEDAPAETATSGLAMAHEFTSGQPGFPWWSVWSGAATVAIVVGTVAARRAGKSPRCP